jgi:hypothetical protein
MPNDDLLLEPKAGIGFIVEMAKPMITSSKRLVKMS